MEDKIYLAAPFFNSVQVELCRRIESEFKGAGIKLVSPRLQHGNGSGGPTPKITTAEQAHEVYVRNVNDLLECTAVLAVVDWLLPEKQQVRVMEEVAGELIKGFETYSLISRSGPLNLPDSGTVWEMGYAAADNKRIAVYKHLKDGKLNLMLSASAEGILYGWEALEQFVWADVAMQSRGLVSWGACRPWNGGIV